MNQHHELARLTDKLSQTLFRLLDGTRTRQELAEALAATADSGAFALSPTERNSLSTLVEQRLTAWAAHALLLA